MKITRLLILVCLAGLLTGLLYHYYGGSNPPAGQRELVRLNVANFGELKRAFNGARGNIRVVALLSPT